MDTIDLNNIAESTIDSLLDEIEETEKRIDSTNKIDSWIRNGWKIGSHVEIYSNSSQLWFAAKIINILNNSAGELLQIEYISKNQISTTQTLRRHDTKTIRPFTKAMNIYLYIFNAIQPISFSPEKTPLISDLDDLSEDDFNVNDNDYDSDTPEPLDTPQPPSDGYAVNINVNYQDTDMKLTDEDDDTSTYSSDNNNNNNNNNSHPKLEFNSRSCEYWVPQTLTKLTMTKLTRAASKIKCITPISQRVAEMKINNFYRRRSVATIDHTVHKLFKLDPDLMKIREEFLEKMDQGNDNDSYDDTDDTYNSDEM